jgi:hypothetical protein
MAVNTDPQFWEPVLMCHCHSAAQEWAAVLASPHVLRLADACSTAEDAALGAALAGKPASFVNKAIEVCTGAIHEWEHAPVKVRAEHVVPLQP